MNHSYALNPEFNSLLAPSIEPILLASIVYERAGLVIQKKYQLAAFLSLSLLGPVVLLKTLDLLSRELQTDGVQNSKKPFSDAELLRIKAENPEYLFIGNSLTTTFIDAPTLSKLTSKRISILAAPGSMTAQWYLSLKNYAIASGVKFRGVIFIFRNEDLTLPTRRAHTRFNDLLETAALDSGEELLHQTLNNFSKDWRSRISDSVNSFFNRERLENLFTSKIKGFIYKFLLGQSEIAQARKATNELFDLKNLKKVGEPQTDLAPGTMAFDFDKNVAKSFLPTFISMAQQNEFSLLFVRIQKRPLKDGSLVTDPPELKTYAAKLEQYIRKSGAQYHDFRGDPELPLSVYGNGDHINEDFKKQTTVTFYKRLGSFFK